MLINNFPRNVESMNDIPVHIDLTPQPDWNLLKTPACEITPEYIFDLECSKVEKRMREEDPDRDDFLLEVEAWMETSLKENEKRNEKRRKTAKKVKRHLEGCTDDLDMVKRVCSFK